MIKHLIFVTFGIIYGITSVAASSQVTEYTLDNGLLILIKEDHRAPVVVSQLWYKVGASNEHLGITGVSHVLEHMMFKGTKTLAPGEFSKIIAANGGRENAFTSRDYTGYYQKLANDRLAISFELEADRMRNLVLLEDEFAKEIKVVMEERRMRVEDNPQSYMVERFMATAFLNSPYQNPVIGWMDDLENMTLADLQVWYEKWYAPNQATLVVVGDVEPEAVFKLAKKYFGAHQPGPPPLIKPRKEIKQQGIRRMTVKVPAQLPLLMMGYHVPGVANAKEAWEPYALDVLAEIFDGGHSARFANDLIRGSQIASSTGVSYDGFSRHDVLFVLSGVPSQGHTVADLESAFREQLKRIQDTPPSQEELTRLKAQVVAAKVYEQDSVFYQAMQLGSLSATGLDWRLADQYVDNIKAVTADQVQQVAQKYFHDNSLTIGHLEPLPIDPATTKPGVNAGGHHAH